MKDPDVPGQAQRVSDGGAASSSHAVSRRNRTDDAAVAAWVSTAPRAVPGYPGTAVLPLARSGQTGMYRRDPASCAFHPPFGIARRTRVEHWPDRRADVQRLCVIRLA